MRAFGALVVLEWRRYWPLPLVAFAIALALVYFTSLLAAAMIVSTAVGLWIAATLGTRAASDANRYLFARPVSCLAVFGATATAAFSLALAAWAAALVPALVLVPGQFGWQLLPPLALSLDMTAAALVAGIAVAGLRARSADMVISALVIAAMVACFAWVVPPNECFMAVPTWVMDSHRGLALLVPGLVVAICLGATARGVCRGRGVCDRTAAATWRALAFVVALAVAGAGAWVAHLRGATVDRLDRIVYASASGASGWVAVSGPVSRATNYAPAFIVHAERGVSDRIPGLFGWPPVAFSADGAVVVALATLRGNLRAPLVIGDLTDRVTWRVEREVPLDDWKAQVALSPSGHRLAIGTALSVTVIELDSMTVINRTPQPSLWPGILKFRNERDLLAQRDATTSQVMRGTHLVVIDVDSGRVAEIGQYDGPGIRRSSVDERGRYVLVHSGTGMTALLQEFDVERPGAPPRTWPSLHSVQECPIFCTRSESTGASHGARMPDVTTFGQDRPRPEGAQPRGKTALPCWETCGPSAACQASRRRAIETRLKLTTQAQT